MRLRLISLLLAVMLILAGCGDEKDSVKGVEDLKVEINNGSTEESADKVVTAPVFTRTEWIDNRYAEDGTLLVQGEFIGAEVSGEGYEVAAKAVKDYFAEKEKAFRESMDLYEEAALEEMQYAVDFGGYSSSVECSGERVDSSVISIKCFHYDYSGGVHGNYGSVGAVFDAQTGAALSFWDLAKDKEAFADATLSSCLTQVSAEYGEGLYSDYEEIIRSVWAEEPNWYLDAAGIRVIFTPYEIGPYAMGEVYVTLPYQELADLMKPEYQMGCQQE